MIVASEALARCALQREESRGGHTRLDHAEYHPFWSTVNSTINKNGEEMKIGTTPLPDMPADLKKLFEEEH
jgi:succinate dehydrogenase / fumarate reductase flavoprotein subunit